MLEGLPIEALETAQTIQVCCLPHLCAPLSEEAVLIISYPGTNIYYIY
jgi:hypothetical protein